MISTESIRFGMIGTGWVANTIVDDFRRCEGIELTAVTSRNPERASDFAKAHGVPIACSATELLARGDLDVIYIATPHHNHHELALAAIRAGKGVLVEKAFTTSRREAEELVDAARSAGTFLMEAMWMSFNPAIVEVLALVRAGAIGDPRTLQASFGFAAPRDGGSRLWDPARAGGSLLDQGVYPLALAQLVFGTPASVAATGSYLGYDGKASGVDTELGMVLGYDGGQQAVLASSIRSVLPLSASIGGAEGLIELAEAFWSGTSFTVRRPDQPPEPRSLEREGSGYVPMLRAVREAMIGGWLEHPQWSHEASVTLMATVDHVRARLLRLA